MQNIVKQGIGLLLDDEYFALLYNEYSKNSKGKNFNMNSKGDFKEDFMNQAQARGQAEWLNKEDTLWVRVVDIDANGKYQHENLTWTRKTCIAWVTQSGNLDENNIFCPKVSSYSKLLEILDCYEIPRGWDFRAHIVYATKIYCRFPM